MGNILNVKGPYEWGAIGLVGLASSFAVVKELSDRKSGVSVSRFKCTKTDTKSQVSDKIRSLSQVDQRTVKWRRHLFLAVIITAIALIVQVKPEPKSIAVAIIVIWIAVYIFTVTMDDREKAMRTLRGCLSKLA